MVLALYGRSVDRVVSTTWFLEIGNGSSADISAYQCAAERFFGRFFSMRAVLYSHQASPGTSVLHAHGQLDIGPVSDLLPFPSRTSDLLLRIGTDEIHRRRARKAHLLHDSNVAHHP